MKQLFFLSIFLIAFFCSCTNSQSAPAAVEEDTEQAVIEEEIPEGPYADISVEQFKEKMSIPDVVIIDVRTPEETALGMIERATELNFDSPAFDKVLTMMDPDRTYLIYCRNGDRSGQTCQKLSEMGFKKLYNLAEGYDAWKAAGY